MTRGKNATAAAGRRTQAEHHGEIEKYQRKVAQLTAESKKAADATERDRLAHRETVRKLQAQLQEGVSAELLAAQAEVRDLRNERASWRAESEQQARRLSKFYDNVMDFVMANNGMTRLEAVEWVLHMQGDELATIDVDNTGTKFGLSAERVRSLQKVRGIR